jgi:putative transcriptional regulator
MISSLTNLTGQCLIAMPQLEDPRFHRAVVYVCAHDPETGAMGIILNKPVTNIAFEDLLKECQVSLNPAASLPATPIVYGGPVEPNRGFVLHTLDYKTDETVPVAGTSLGLTTTLEILRDRAEGRGPTRILLALGYAGWTPMQIETEMANNSWINVNIRDLDLLFSSRWTLKWQLCLESSGISLNNLSSDAGHA